MITVCPQSQLERAIASGGAPRVLASMSKTDGPVRPTGIAENDYLALLFNDITEPREGLVAPSAEMVAAALAFAAADDRPLVVHCYAGVSRSPAFAYAIACMRGPERDEAEIATELRGASPSATPNRLIVALADAALGRDGRMVAAIEAIGRGADAFEGETFTLGGTS